jgi:hypothetical protein
MCSTVVDYPVLSVGVHLSKKETADNWIHSSRSKGIRQIGRIFLSSGIPIISVIMLALCCDAVRCKEYCGVWEGCEKCIPRIALASIIVVALRK